MTYEQLLNITSYGTSVIDVREEVGLPGLLRFTSITRDTHLKRYRVFVEFYEYSAYLQYPDADGMLKFGGIYADFDQMLLELEGFLGKPLSEWRDFSKFPYIDFRAMEDYLRGIGVSGYNLPDGGAFECLTLNSFPENCMMIPGVNVPGVNLCRKDRQDSGS